VGSPSAVSFAIKGGRVWIDAANWARAKGPVLTNAAGLLRDDGGRPALAVSEAEAASKDSQFIACEVECRRAGSDGLFVELDMADR
jgi:hypothetical protein